MSLLYYMKDPLVNRFRKKFVIFLSNIYNYVKNKILYVKLLQQCLVSIIAIEEIHRLEKRVRSKVGW